MPPGLALLLCSVFVIAILHHDRNLFSRKGIALWIPTLWFMYAVSKPLGLWFGSYRDVESGSPVDRTFLIILLLTGLIILQKRSFAWLDRIKRNPALVMVIIYMLVSVLWSEIPDISFRRWVKELVAFIMAFYVASEENPLLSIERILRRAMYILIPFSILLIKYFPDMGVDYGLSEGGVMWIGVTTHKNNLCKFCIIVILFIVWDMIRRMRKGDFSFKSLRQMIDIAILVMALYLLSGPHRIYNNSATAFVALILGLFTITGLFWTNRRGSVPKPRYFIFLLIFLVVYGAITPFMGKLALFDISAALGRSSTLTGRVRIWTTLVPSALEKPFLGHGLGGFWTAERLARIATHAHNGYLDSMLTLGVFGLCFVLFFLFSCARRAFDLMNVEFAWGVFSLSCIFILAVHNVAESSINSFTSSLDTLILFFYASSIEIRKSDKPN